MMRSTPSLLDTVHGLLARTYGLLPAVGDPARFVIGDRGYRCLYGVDQTAAGSGCGDGARLLVRETADCVRVALYYPDALIRRLESYPPQYGVGDENVDAFAVLVEELDHLLVVAERASERRPVSLFELELHANVSKYLVLSRFLAGRARRVGPEVKLWLRERLFSRVRYCDDDPSARQRYRDAARWAVRFLDGLSFLDPAARLQALRAFHRASSSDKVRAIAALGGG
jgi:hypothetical protein